MELKAFAKINLTLEVLGRRSDGYHEVRTALQTIDLADHLHFTPAHSLEFECSVPELAGEDNLVWKAACALREFTGCDKGARIRLQKQIPAGMGLGGGSSDAAATLNALNELWELGLDEQQLSSIASSLGSDVPFFIRGGTALGEGRGESISQLSPIPPSWIVLACPETGLATGGKSTSSKTASLYSMITKGHYSDGSYTQELADSLKESTFSEQLLFNVFEEVALSAFDGFDQVRQQFADAVRGDRDRSRDAEEVSVHLSGTGPALYSFVSGKEEADRILNCLKKSGLKAYGVRTVQTEAISSFASVSAGQIPL